MSLYREINALAASDDYFSSLFDASPVCNASTSRHHSNYVHT